MFVSVKVEVDEDVDYDSDDGASTIVVSSSRSCAATDEKAITELLSSRYCQLRLKRLTDADYELPTPSAARKRPGASSLETPPPSKKKSTTAAASAKAVKSEPKAKQPAVKVKAVKADSSKTTTPTPATGKAKASRRSLPDPDPEYTPLSEDGRRPRSKRRRLISVDSVEIKQEVVEPKKKSAATTAANKGTPKGAAAAAAKAKPSPASAKRGGRVARKKSPIKEEPPEPLPVATRSTRSKGGAALSHTSLESVVVSSRRPATRQSMGTPTSMYSDYTDDGSQSSEQQFASPERVRVPAKISPKTTATLDAGAFSVGPFKG